MLEMFNQGWVGIAIYAAVDCLMIVVGVQISDAITRRLERRAKRKFDDIICEACNKAGRKLYLCADKQTWLCWKCKPVFNSEWRARQREARSLENRRAA